MNLQEFVQSHRFVHDVSDEVEDAEPKAGFVYHQGLYITITGGGRFHLFLGNQDWLQHSLEELEVRLYDWAVGEGFFEQNTPLEDLKARFEALKAQLLAAGITQAEIDNACR